MVEDNVKRKKVPFSITGIVLIAGLLLFLLGFHIVIYSGGVTLIPKEHLSFSETIVDVDDIIRQYNTRDLGERLRGEGVNMYLVRKLEDKGIITISSSTEPPSGSGIFGTEQRITKSMYDRIQNGMSYRQVISIIGQEGEELSRTEMVDISTVMYMWQNDDGSNMNIMFQNGKVIQKAQFGLR
jgi:hypothetical protein